MHGQMRERWMQLCEEAANEQSSEKLMALVKEIGILLEDKEQRLKGSAKNTTAHLRQSETDAAQESKAEIADSR
jgi:hypothetical protein